MSNDRFASAHEMVREYQELEVAMADPVPAEETPEEDPPADEEVMNMADEKDPDYDVRCKLVEIFGETERYDKITITLDPVSHDVTIVYENMDEEWFNELRTL